MSTNCIDSQEEYEIRIKNLRSHTVTRLEVMIISTSATDLMHDKSASDRIKEVQYIIDCFDYMLERIKCK